MKTSFVIATLAGFASASYRQVRLFEGENCSGEVIADKVLHHGLCKKMDKSLTVVSPQLSSAFDYYRLSGDNDNEVYLFQNEPMCEEYGPSFNPNIEVAFIRAPGADECYPCKECGSAKSVHFKKVPHPHSHDDNKEKESNEVQVDAEEESDGKSSTLVVSSIAVLCATAASLLA